MMYPSIRIEGPILSPDILERIEDMNGQKPSDFGFKSSARVKDEIARAWADACDYWRIFQRRIRNLKPDSPATGETRQFWIQPLLGLLGYQLEYQPRGAEINGKTYPISHRDISRALTPVHIIGCRDAAGLDRKPEYPHRRMSAHALVQEFLNLEEQLFGIVTNGRLLRLLRDSSRLIRLSYVEFDLERIFNDALYADFAVLYRLLHSTRFPQTGFSPAQCLLEQYHQEGIEQGARIRDGLRDAVTQAIRIFGSGLLEHPGNHALRGAVQSGKITAPAFFRRLLRLIYRILFLSVVEERGLVFPPGAPEVSRNIYRECYGIQRLRRLARLPGLRSRRHHDAWLSLLSTFRVFESPEAAASLGATAFGGDLFNPEGFAPLHECRLSNADFLEALDRLCSFDDPRTRGRLPVNFGALATEEFGSVYESLLELHPVILQEPSWEFGFQEIAGNERKITGSYYTPSSLVNSLLDTALEPLLESAVKQPDAEQALLSLKVCDPACGSGHFLIAAAQRVARRLALIRSKGDEPSPDQQRHALRQVISRCIHGVDLNPMAVELCRVALWLEAVEPGKPLTFLDHHIKCGNSLLGVTPELLAAPLPDAAFTALEGDSKDACKKLKQINKNEQTRRDIGEDLFAVMEQHDRGELERAAATLVALTDDNPEEFRRKKAAWVNFGNTPEYQRNKLHADAWCAAFVMRKTFHPSQDDPRLPSQDPFGVTQGMLDRVLGQTPVLSDAPVMEETRRLAKQYRFFHWHLEFPDVFARGGFDCAIGNPPWDQIQCDPRQFFGPIIPAIANAQNMRAREKMIEELKDSDPNIYEQYKSELRFTEGIQHIIHNSGHYPLTSFGRLNTAPLFTELYLSLVNINGRTGLIIPSGIATDSFNQYFFQDVMDTGSLVSLFDFENRKGIFPGVHRSTKFCLFTCLSPKAGGSGAPAEFIFFALDVGELRDPDRRVALSLEDIALINPNTRTCPIFRSRADAELTRYIYRRVPVLIREPNDDRPGENPWNIKFKLMFMMNSDSHLFRIKEQLESDGWLLDGNIFRRGGEAYLPLYEAKLIHHYDHRWATYEGLKTRDVTPAEKSDPRFTILPRYWVHEKEIQSSLSNSRNCPLLLGYRRISNTTNERTFIMTIMPPSAAGDSVFLVTPENTVNLRLLTCCSATIAFDFIVRQKMGGTNLNFYLTKQLPVLPPEAYAVACPWSNQDKTIGDWLLPRVLELTYTAWDIQPFARDCGYDGPPFPWDEERRFRIRCELDAAFFHLYLGSAEEWRKQSPALLKHFPTPRKAVSYIMDTFPIVQRKDLAAHNCYRTKDVILSLYDALLESIRTGAPFVSPLSPPPGEISQEF